MADRLRWPSYDVLWAVLLGAAVTGPLLLGRGFALVGDMVFVPEQPWKAAWLGADGSVPRAVPSDAIVSALTTVVPGDLLQKAVLLGLVVGAALGMSRLVGERALVPRLAAATLYVWNPFVYERLAIGHWALLVGYAALPWVVVAARRLGRGEAGAWAPLAACLAIAGWTSPTGGALALLTALVVVGFGAGARTTLGCGALGVVVNLPWIVPGVLSSGAGLSADPVGVAAFAARADTPYGVVGSLLSFGGLWKESVDAPGRDSLLLAGAALALTGVGLAGLWLARRREPALTRALGVLAVVGLVLAAAPATGPGREIVTWLVQEVPGGGLLRDSQKWVAPLVLAVCVGLAHALSALARRFGEVHARWWGVAAGLLPIAVLPALAWGLLGGLAPATYPDTWSSLRTAMERTGAAEGRTLVLPFAIYRRYEWNDARAVLDPTPRFLPGDIVVDDSLAVDGGTVGGESVLAAEIRGRVSSGVDLAGLLADEGIGWVLVDKGSGVPVTEPVGTVAYENADFRLIDVGTGDTSSTDSRAEAWAVYVADLLAVAAVAAVVVLGARARRRVYTWHEGA